MRPRLLVLSGPLKDETFPLPEGETGIGREASNQIAIGDPSVSRRHCSVRWEGGRFVVRDLGSRNGTVVNGSAVEEQWLQHGDELAIGDSSFLFLLEDEDLEPAAGRVEFEEDLGTSATTILQPRDSVYLQPERLSRELPANARLARNLNALLKISRIVHAIANLNELQEQLLELIFEVVPADRGAILLGEGEGPNFNSEFVRTRKGGGVARVKVSRTVARQVFEQGVAILGSDAAEDVLPSGVEGISQPIHELVLVAMGMPIFDNCDLEQLSKEAARRRRWSFLLTASPAAVPGATGSVLNPIATF